MESESTEIISDNWTDLKQYTSARIAIGRAGVSVPTKNLLEFQLAHAKARDAVHKPFNQAELFRYLSNKKLTPIQLQTLATNRNLYLKNPDLGRRLSSESLETLKQLELKPSDLGIIIGDGLSARAVEENAIPFLKELLSILPNNYSLSPVPLVKGARVALGDEVGEILQSEVLVFLIGERPGLSSPNSMGIYITYKPKIGRKDSERNCISNIRPDGLSYKEAAVKTMYILEKAKQLKLTGVNLKDDMNYLLKKE